jgi:beta-lactamase regulating signal transducer with metallopeptidase domain
MIDYTFLYLVKSLLLSIVWIAAWAMFLLFLRRVKAETRYFMILLIFAVIPLLPFITSDYLPAHGSGIYSRFELFKTVKLDNYMSVGGISQIEINPGKTDLTFESQPGDEGNLSEKPEPGSAGFKEVMILIWAVVFSLLFLKIGAGLFLLGRISAGSIEAGSGNLRQVVLRSAEKLGLQRLPDVRVSGIIATPVSFGIIHPVIILPEFIVSEMSGEDIEQIIIHEMAHIRRGDYPVVLFQRLMECVFFYNPAVWFLGLRLSMLREECCDSIVVEMASDRAKYAANILAVAGRGLKPGLQVANGITGRGGLFRRIEKIMEDGDNYKDMGVRKKIILAVCGSVAGLLLVMCANSSVKETAADSPYSGFPVEISSIMEEMEKYNKSCLTDTYLMQNEIRLNYVERAISKASQLSDADLRKESLLKLNMMKAAIISDPERSAVIYREQIAAARELGDKGIEGECLLKLGHHNLSFGAGNRRENEKMISEAEILLTGAGRNDYTF